jgi:hypothetical protein
MTLPSRLRRHLVGFTYFAKSVRFFARKQILRANLKAMPAEKARLNQTPQVFSGESGFFKSYQVDQPDTALQDL